MTISQFDFTAPFEGVVPHLYLDSEGLMTCGVGFRVFDRQDLKRFPWDRLIAAQADYVEVERLGPGHSLEKYHLVTAARLSQDGMRLLFDAEVWTVRSALQAHGWKLQNHPEVVQVAIVDIFYNCGVGAKFPAFRAAVEARDYALAAVESHRKDVSDARNKATADLLKSAASSS